MFVKPKTLLKLFFTEITYFSSAPLTFPSKFKFKFKSELSQLLKQHKQNHHFTLQIHARIIVTQQRDSRNSHLTAALIRNYIAGSNVVYARALFDQYPCPKPIFLWNLVVQVSSRDAGSVEALVLLRRMLRAGSSVRKNVSAPDEYTLTFGITSCSCLRFLGFGGSVHGLVVKNGYEGNVFVGNALVNMYAVFGDVEGFRRVFDGMGVNDMVSWTSLMNGFMRNGDFDRCKEVFEEMPMRNVVSWAVLMSGCVEFGKYNEAVRCFRDMLCDGVMPNEAVIVCVLNACAHLEALDQGKWIHVYIERNMSKVKWSSNVCNALIDMYTKCGELDCAKSVFDGIVGKRDVYTWTSMISGFAMYGHGQDALRVFRQMLAEGVKPDSITLVGVLNGCSHSGLVKDGCSIFYSMKGLWNVEPRIEHYGCLIDLFGRAGQLVEAFEVVKEMSIKPDIVIYRALISACRTHGDVYLGKEIIDHISRDNLNDNGGGYVLLSNLYASLGRWDGVNEVRTQMQNMNIDWSPGCSWYEIDGTVHEFLASDQSHPQIVETRCKLLEVLKRISSEGGYVANTKPVLFDLSEEDKEEAVSWHSEKLALAFGLLKTDGRMPIRITKNLRICQDCHSAMKAVSRVFCRDIIVRDCSRFHTFRGGSCSCADYW